MDKVDVSVVIPAYNEERRIARTIESVIAYFKEKPVRWELIVVNDGSRDGTAAVVRGFSRRAPLVLVDNSVNRGKGFAVHEGMARARGDIALFMDADNSTRVGELEKMMPFFDQGYGVVIGSRRMPTSDITRRQPRAREIGGRVFGLVVRLLFGLPFDDTQAGFKAFSARARERLFPLQRTFGWSFDAELLLLARRAGERIAQVPIKWQNDQESKVKLAGIAKAFWDLALLRIRYGK